MKQILYRLTNEVLARSIWWKQYITGSPYDAKFICNDIITSPNDISLYTNTQNGKQIRMFNYNMIPIITKEEEILLRINKLYSKCKTTEHWSIE